MQESFGIKGISVPCPSWKKAEGEASHPAPTVVTPASCVAMFCMFYIKWIGIDGAGDEMLGIECRQSAYSD